MPVVFLISPFTAASAGDEPPDVFDAVQEAVRVAANRAAIEVVRADDIFAGGVVIDQVRQAIESADLIIGVCTGRNPNVFYELGLAEVLGHKPILIASSAEDLPFDVQHWRAQLYGGGGGLETLSDRVGRAMKDTLAERERAVRTARRLNSSLRTASDAAPSAAEPGFQEEARGRILEAFDAIQSLAQTNWDLPPTEPQLVEELTRTRIDYVDRILEVVAPAIQDHTSELSRPLRLLTECFEAKVNPGSGGYLAWQEIHQSWTYLTLRACLALATHTKAPTSLAALLNMPGPNLPQQRDRAPLFLNSSFNWNRGFSGGDFAFMELVELGRQSAIMSEFCKPTREPIDAICGSDLVVSLARWFWEETNHEGLNDDHRPYVYPGFPRYECHRISWVARHVENDETFSQAIGAENLESARAGARQAFPRVIRLSRNGAMGKTTCWDWEEAIQT